MADSSGAVSKGVSAASLAKMVPLATAASRHDRSTGHPPLALVTCASTPAMSVHGTLLLVRRKRKPPTGISSQASSPHGSATAMNGLRRPQRDVVLSERRPMMAPVSTGLRSYDSGWIRLVSRGVI
eukprot:scaffold78218_cov36-Phaeocystis_antarctica.AAC.1